MKAFSLALSIAVTIFASGMATATTILPDPTSSTTGNGTVSLAPDASVFAIAIIGPGQSGASTATLSYDFEVTGPADGSAIVDITGEVLVTYDDVAGGTFFNVGAGIALGGGGLMSAFCGSSYDPADCVLGVNETVPAGVEDNTEYTLNLSADVSAENFLTGATTTVTALVDPMISFDPSFNSNGFSLVLSPGVGNQFIPNAVPEPPTLFMTGALVLFGAICRLVRDRAVSV